MAPTILRVISEPGKVNGAIARVVDMSDGMAVAETLTPGGWVPGGATIAEVLKAPPSTPADTARVSGGALTNDTGSIPS